MYMSGEATTTTAEIDGNQYIIQYIPQSDVMQVGHCTYFIHNKIPLLIPLT